MVEKKAKVEVKNCTHVTSMDMSHVTCHIILLLLHASTQQLGLASRIEKKTQQNVTLFQCCPQVGTLSIVSNPANPCQCARVPPLISGRVCHHLDTPAPAHFGTTRTRARRLVGGVASARDRPTLQLTAVCIGHAAHMQLRGLFLKFSR